MNSVLNILMSFGADMYTVLLGINLEVEFLGHRIISLQCVNSSCCTSVWTLVIVSYISKPFWLMCVTVSLYNVFKSLFTCLVVI